MTTAETLRNGTRTCGSSSPRPGENVSEVAIDAADWERLVRAAREAA